MQFNKKYNNSNNNAFCHNTLFKMYSMIMHYAKIPFASRVTKHYLRRWYFKRHRLFKNDAKV